MAAILSQAQTYPSSNLSLLSVTKPGSTAYSGCWGWYQANKNKEYALVQGMNGYLYFIDVTIPTAPILRDSVLGNPNINREVKTYQNYCYSGAGGYYTPLNKSLQIIDMNYLPDSVHVVYSGSDLFGKVHTLWVDKTNLYCASVGHGTSVSSMEVFSLATPTAPVLLRKLDDDVMLSAGVHDMYVRNDTVYASARQQGLQVYKFTGTNFVPIGSLSNYAESGSNHSSYLTDNGKTIVFCDEMPTGLAIKSADVSNLNNIVVKALFKPANHPQFVAHNPYIVGNKWAFVSCYKEGLNLYDISDPTSPVLAAYFDTYPQGGANTGDYENESFDGNWGAYPYFPSGNILAVDITNGAFMLKPNPVIGLKEQASHNLTVRILQNPASQFISYELSGEEYGEYTLQLKDALGRTVLNSKNEFSATCHTINASDIPGGIYFLSIDLNGKHFSTKVSLIH